MTTVHRFHIQQNILSLVCFVFMSYVFLFVHLTPVKAAIRTWDGGGGADTKWSTCANWDGPDTCPIAGDTVTFNSTSTNNSTVDPGFGGSIGVVNINAGYTGTITVSETLAITSTFTQSAGTFDMTNQAVSFGSTLILNAGSIFKASSGTTTINKTFTVNGGSFNANGGTIAFAGGGATLTCNNISFNAVTFTGQTGAKVIGSTCSLPLGANPSIPLAITLNGTLSGTGTLTLVSGTSTIAAGSTLSGFTGLSAATLDVNGGNFGTITTLTTSGTLTVAGTWDASTISNLTSSSTFALSTGGAFTAPTGTMIVDGAFTVTGGTFTGNGGTVDFAGSSASLTCNNITFSNVSFAGQTGTKTVGSDCSLPLGINPTVPNSLILDGTLSGTGTLTFTTGTFTMDATGVLSGFTTLNPSALTVNGGNFGTVANMTASGAVSVAGTWDTSSYTTFVTNSTLTLNSGAIFSGANGMTTNSTFTINTGATFTASSGTTNITQTFTVNGGTFHANGGTIDFSGGGSTLTCNNISFANVTFTGQTGTKSVTSTCSLPLGANPTIPKSITLAGTLSGTGTLTISSGSTTTINTGGTFSGFTGLSVATLALNGGSFGGITTLTASSAVTIAGTVDASTITTFTASSSVTFNTGAAFTAPATFNIAGNLTLTAGTFTANGGTVVLNGNSQTISGAFTFYNLTKSVSADATLTFPASTTTTITNILSLNGTAVATLSLRSSATPTQWSIDPQGQRILSYLNVKDSNNINATQVDAGTGSIASSNNTNWNFPPAIVTNNTYYVSPTGSDSNDGSLASPFATITHAVSVTNAGDTVRLLAGTFSEHVVIQNKHGVSGHPIRIVGDTMDQTQYPVVDGGDPDYTSTSSTAFLAFLIQNSSWLNFERIKISNSSESDFKLDSSHYITFRRNIFDMHRYGILIDGKTSHILMEYNEAHQNFPDGSTWTQLKGSKWEGGAFTSFGGAGMNVIRYNYFHKLFNAIYLSPSVGFLNNASDANVWVYRNRFYDVIDDPFEPESYAFKYHFFYNTLVNTHRMVSLAPSASGLLGPIYVYANQQIDTTDPTLEVISAGKRNSAWKVDLSTSYYANGVLAFNNSVDISAAGTGGYGMDKLTSSATAINNFNEYNNAYQTLNQTMSQSSLILTNSELDYDMSQTSLGYTETHGFENTAPGFTDSSNEDFRLLTSAPARGKSRAITASTGFASATLVSAGADLGAYQYGENDFMSIPDPVYVTPPGGEDPSFPANESWPADTEVGYNPLSAPLWTTITPTPSPTPTSAPVQQHTSSGSSSSSNSTSSSVHVCSDSPSGSPDIFEVHTDNTTATIYMSPPPMPYSSFDVSYSRNPNIWEYNTSFHQGFSSGAITFSIHYLSPNTTYYFRTRASNGCSSGSWSNIVRATTTRYPKQTRIFYKSLVSYINNSFTSAVRTVFHGTPAKRTNGTSPGSSPSQPATIYAPTPVPEPKAFVPLTTPKAQAHAFCILWFCF